MSLFSKIRKRVGIAIHHKEYPTAYHAKVKIHIGDTHIASWDMTLKSKDKKLAHDTVQQYLKDNLKHSIQINRKKGQ